MGNILKHKTLQNIEWKIFIKYYEQLEARSIRIWYDFKIQEPQADIENVGLNTNIYWNLFLDVLSEPIVYNNLLAALCPIGLRLVLPRTAETKDQRCFSFKESMSKKIK